MKLESMKSSKFEAFKTNEILNTMRVIGGEAIPGSGTVNLATKKDDHCDNKSHDDGPGYDIVNDMVQPIGSPQEVRMWIQQGILVFTGE